MQKKLIALAIAGLASSAAFAQSNVTIYGIADVGFANLTTSNNDVGSVDTVRGIESGLLSTSRIGFKGAEDLGNGLKAIFTLEYGLQLDNNDGIGGARQEFVGLTGGFGTVVAGRLQTPAYDHAVKYNVLSGSRVSPQEQTRAAIGSGINQGDRVDNAVAYVSPNLSGFTLKAAYSFLDEAELKGNANDTTAEGAYVLSADYDNGPLSVGLVYRAVRDSMDANGSEATKEWGLGGSYDFGVATVKASYQRYKNDADSTTTGIEDAKVWTVGATVPVTAAGAVHVAYSRSTGDNSGANDDFGAKSWALAYTHSLSKRTTAYAGYAYTKNESDTVNNTVYGVTNALEGGERMSGFIAGLRHSF